MKILITGVAGFIGFHLAMRCVQEGYEVIGLDNINDYYDVNLKYARLGELGIEKERIEYNRVIKSNKFDNMKFIKLNLEDKNNIFDLFKSEKINQVCHLAAQAGVRYSLKNPYAYIDSNIIGFLNILEAVRHYNIDYLCFASSSSVYGINKKQPFSVKDPVEHPISLYAATKKSDELIAHVYSYLFKIPIVGLRFFTVYGPWGRPDMALFKFTKLIIEDKEIEVYNYGKMKRDFTYIDDIIKGVIKVLNKVPESVKDWNGELGESFAPYKIYNIGNGKPVNLMEFIQAIENELGKKAKKKYLPLQPGDVVSTYADTTELMRDFGYKPETSIKTGIRNFINWYKWFYKI